MAEECASIGFDVRHGLRVGQHPKQIEQTISRHVDGVLKIANVILTMRRTGIEPDISPSTVQVLRELWMDTVAEVARGTLPDELAEKVLKMYESRIDGAATSTTD